MEGKTYSLNKVEKILNKIDNLATFKSYEFINADIKENIIDKNNIDVTIYFNESKNFMLKE